MERAGNEVESDESDEDYVADRDDAGSPTGDTDEEGSDSDASGDGGEAKPVKEEGKEPVAPEPAAAGKKRREEGEDDGREKKKKKRKKKDPNAPKRGLSSFMYFSQAEREVLKEKEPGLAFKEAGRIIGDKWKKLSEEEKEPYEKLFRHDKARYQKEMAEYRSGKQRAGGGSSGEESD